MKKICFTFSIMIISGFLSAQTFPDAISEASKGYTNVQALNGPADAVFEDHHILIVYFGGHNVKRVSDDLSRLTGATVIRIEDLDYHRNYSAAGRKSTFGGMTKIAPVQVDIADYDVIIIGTVVWAWNMSPAVRTFLKENKDRLKNKKTAFFTVAGGTAPDKIVKKMSRMTGSEVLAMAGWNNPEIVDTGQEAYKRLIQGFVTRLAKALKK